MAYRKLQAVSNCWIGFLAAMKAKYDALTSGPLDWFLGLEINWNAAAGCLFFQHGATCSIIKDTTRTSFLIAFLKAFLNALLKLS